MQTTADDVPDVPTPLWFTNANEVGRNILRVVPGVVGVDIGCCVAMATMYRGDPTRAPSAVWVKGVKCVRVRTDGPTLEVLV